MRPIVSTALLLLALVVSPQVHANYSVDRWNVTDGLPVNGVTAVHREPGGYLWLATFDGLARFDGRQFTVFDSSDALESRRLVDVRQSSDGMLWVLSEEHRLARFDGREFHRIDLAQGLPDERVFTIRLGPQGRLWIGSAAGAAQWDGQRFLPAVSGVASSGDVRSLFFDRDGDLWVGQRDGWVQRIRDGRVLERHLAGDGINDSETSDIAQLPDGSMLFATRSGVMHLRDGAVLPVAAIGGRVSFALGVYPDASLVVRTAEGNVWLADVDAPVGRLDPSVPIGRSEMVRTAPDGSVWTNAVEYLLRDGVRVFDSPCALRDLVFDRDASVWIASSCEGLVRIHPRRATLFAEQGSPSSVAIYGMAQAADGAIWISSLAAVQRWRDGQLELELATRSPTGPQHLTHGIDPNNLRTIYIDHDASVWVGQQGVCQVSGSDCVVPPGLPSALRYEEVTAIHRDRSGSLWIGGNQHLWRVDPDGRVEARKNASREPRRGAVRSILEQADGSLWFGTVDIGIWHRSANRDWTLVDRGQGLSSDSVRDMHEDDAGNIWVATEDRGLCRMSDPGGALRIGCLGVAQGLYSNSLHRILADDRGRFWFNSNRGVFWVEQRMLDAVLDGHVSRVRARVFSRRDGLPNPEGNGGVRDAGIRLADGRFAFPTQRGVAVFDPGIRRPPPPPPTVVVEAIELADGRKIPAAAVVDLPQGDRSFVLRVTTLSETLTDPAFIRYRVESGNSHWVDLGAETALHFQRLAPGHTQIELAALSAIHDTLGPVTRIEIRIPALWWETRAFQGASVLLLALAAATWLWLRARDARARKRELERRVTERTAELQVQQRHTEAALQMVQQQREEISRLAAVRSQFFASVGHELRTPLSLITGPLLDVLRGTPLSARSSEIMLRNARRLERLLTQLLDLDRIDVGRFPLQPSARDLAELLREATDAFKPVAHQHDLQISVECPALAVVARVDPDQIVRVLGNLLSNAVKFTPRGGSVVARLRVDADLARIEIDDSGEGVPAEWRERIFDRFAQVGAQSTRSREGAGLGLALSFEIATLHGGRLWAEERPGGGARFVLVLPVVHGVVPIVAEAATDATPVERRSGSGRQREATAANEKRSSKPRRELERRRILVAEDNADLRAYIAEVLGGEHRVLSAADGLEALEIARQELPDLIVSDVVMPNFDGFELAQNLRRNKLTAGIPLIFLTARASDADEIEGLLHGADHYLRKPFDADVLRAHVAAALHTVERLKRNIAAAGSSVAGEAGKAETGAGQAGAEVNGSAAASFLRQAEAWFANHLHDETQSVDSMAEALNVSRATLNRRFQGAYSESPASMLRRRRLELAREMLERNEGSVSEVAYAVGFASLSVFSRAFREHFGVTPSHLPDEAGS